MQSALGDNWTELFDTLLIDSRSSLFYQSEYPLKKVKSGQVEVLS